MLTTQSSTVEKYTTFHYADKVLATQSSTVEKYTTFHYADKVFYHTAGLGLIYRPNPAL
jgi:hypothetical protein